MSKRDRRENDRWSDRRDGRDGQPEDEQQRRTAEPDAQEGDSLTALKAILSKVAALLKPLQLTQDESIRLVEQLYGSVLEMDVKLAGEADDTRKSSVLSHIQNTTVRREGDRIVVEYPGNTQAAPNADNSGATSKEPDAPSPSGGEASQAGTAPVEARPPKRAPGKSSRSERVPAAAPPAEAASTDAAPEQAEQTEPGPSDPPPAEEEPSDD